LYEEYEQQIKALAIDKEIDDRTSSIFIDLVAAIVSKCE